MNTPMLGLALLALAAPALGRDRPVPDAVPAGPAIDCLRAWDIRESRVRSDAVIDFVTRSGKVYRNTLDPECPRLGFERRFAYSTTIAQLCSTDIITILQAPDLTPGPACGLGRFQPVTLADPRR